MRVSGKADYAVRAMVELAAQASDDPVKASLLASQQEIPMRFLEHILHELKRSGLVMSRPGAHGGYWLAKGADEITIGDVVRSVDGVLASVRGETPDKIHFKGSAEPMHAVWMALRANVRDVLDEVSLADVASAQLPEHVRELAERPDAAVDR